MPRISKLKSHKKKINGVLEKNKSIFCSGARLIACYTKDKILKDVSMFECTLLLKPKERGYESPTIKLYEMWKEDDLMEYTYRFSIPYFNFVCSFSGVCVKSSNFEFRYERHKNPNHKPKHHLHVLDGVPPRYKIHKMIQLDDFLKIIKREFINDDNRIYVK